MPRNVEIKARLADIQTQIALATEICNGESETLIQQDVFFHCERGRLKLRTFADGSGELIFYTRPDQEGPKTSEYVIAPAGDPEKLREALRLAYGEKAVVRKTRLLFLDGRTRIHLDQVDQLGDFLELEVVLKDGEDESVGQAEAQLLMEKLKVNEADLVKTAYVDLLATQG